MNVCIFVAAHHELTLTCIYACVYVCMYNICIYIYIYIYTHTHTYIHTYIHTYGQTNRITSPRIRRPTHPYLGRDDLRYVCVCMCLLCIRVNMCLHVRLCVCVCVCVFLHSSKEDIESVHSPRQVHAYLHACLPIQF